MRFGSVALRPFEKFDAATIQNQGSDRSVAHWMISFPVPWPRWLARHRIMQARQAMSSGQGFHFAIVAEDLPGRPMIGACSATFIGESSRPPELAYWVAPAWQRQGRGKAALRILMSYLFDRDPHLTAIEAAVIVGNTPSSDLLQSLHFNYYEDEYASAPLSWAPENQGQVLLHRFRLWRDDWFSAENTHIHDLISNESKVDQ